MFISWWFQITVIFLFHSSGNPLIDQVVRRLLRNDPQQRLSACDASAILMMLNIRDWLTSPHMVTKVDVERWLSFPYHIYYMTVSLYLWASLCLCVCMRVCVHAHAFLFACLFPCVCVFVFVCTCGRSRLRVRLCVYVCACTPLVTLWMRAHASVDFVWIFVKICIFVVLRFLGFGKVFLGKLDN